jgi:hypothetical protein
MGEHPACDAQQLQVQVLRLPLQLLRGRLLRLRLLPLLRLLLAAERGGWRAAGDGADPASSRRHRQPQRQQLPRSSRGARAGRGEVQQHVPAACALPARRRGAALLGQAAHVGAQGGRQHAGEGGGGVRQLLLVRHARALLPAGRGQGRRQG